VRKLVQQNDQQIDITTAVVIETKVPVGAGQAIIVVINGAIEGCDNIVNTRNEIGTGDRVGQGDVVM